MSYNTKGSYLTAPCLQQLPHVAHLHIYIRTVVGRTLLLLRTCPFQIFFTTRTPSLSMTFIT